MAKSMKTSEIAIIYYECGVDPLETFITNNLFAMQMAVGGFIETVYIAPGLLLVCNEEGLIRGMNPNLIIHSTFILGPNEMRILGNAFVCRQDGENFSSVLPGDLELVSKFIRRMK